jgi:hypothetical protein
MSRGLLSLLWAPVLVAASGCSPTVLLADANNYGFVGVIDGPSHVVASGVNIELCWDQLALDIQCHELDPAADPQLVSLVRFGSLSEAEVEEQLGNDTIDGTAMSGALFYEIQGDETCAQLEDFDFNGTLVDIEEQFYEGGGTYMLVVGGSNVPSEELMTLDFLVPTVGEETAEVAVLDACTSLDATADLVSLDPLTLRSGGSSWVVDWGSLTTDGIGNPMTISNIDQLMLGHYADLSVSDLEAGFLDIELIADQLYYLDVGGTLEADLAEASGDSGAFTGFTEGGTWLLALRCSTCMHPAPKFLTIVQPS